jgi:nitronate monooxygenase
MEDASRNVFPCDKLSKAVMSIKTALTSLLNIEHPILLAPMAGIAGGALASAVTNAGGLGVIGGGYGDKDWLSSELLKAGNTQVGIGFITWSLQKNPSLLEVALAHRPKAMFLSFGDIDGFAPRIKQAGIPLIAQVQNVAQGTEAGGHGGGRATLPLIPAVIDAVGQQVPVVAAGGIADGRGLAAALMLGASGVLCGSVFYASQESLTHPNNKRAVLAGSGDNTVRSSVIDVAREIPWPEQWNIRTLKNKFIVQWAGDLDGLRRNVATELPRYVKARDAGDIDVSAVIVGEAVDLIHRDEGGAAIVQRIVSEAETLLKRAPQMLG